MNVVNGPAWTICLLLLALAASVAPTHAATFPEGQPMKELLPWYHSADEIAATLRSLASNCGSAELEVSQRSQLNVGDDAGAEVNIDVVHVGKSGGGEGKLRALLVFGEHARELISPESALDFVQTLCGDGPEANRASAVLDKVSFTIIPNANPLSRKLVEQGSYCRRTNEDGVDLNRNFGDRHRNSGEVAGSETNPGPSGFSEPESKILKALVDEERPDIYVSVHSGAYLLGTPFGYKRGVSPASEASMMEVLGPISEKYCAGDCPYGNLAELIHYDNPGCDIDYVAEQGTPFVFTWEIFTGSEYRERYVEQARLRRGGGSASLLQRVRRLVRASKRHQAKDTRALRGLVQGPSESDQKVSDCIAQFLPQSEEETQAVVRRWTAAYLELAERVSAVKGRGAVRSF